MQPDYSPTFRARVYFEKRSDEKYLYRTSAGVPVYPRRLGFPDLPAVTARHTDDASNFRWFFQERRAVSRQRYQFRFQLAVILGLVLLTLAVWSTVVVLVINQDDQVAATFSGMTFELPPGLRSIQATPTSTRQAGSAQPASPTPATNTKPSATPTRPSAVRNAGSIPSPTVRKVLPTLTRTPTVLSH